MILTNTTGGTKFSGFSKQELIDFRYDAKIASMRQLLDVLSDEDYHSVRIEHTENLSSDGRQYFYTCVLHVDEASNAR